MDPADVLPTELMLRIFEHLGPVELTRCLAVSSKWRQIANSDGFWRTFCLKRNLLKDDSYVPEGHLPLSPWASSYISHMDRLTQNWRRGYFESYQLTKEDWCCCIACAGNVVAVYYPRASRVCLYTLAGSGLDQLISVYVALPNAIAIPDLFIDERYVVLSRGNVVLVYNIYEGLRLYRSIAGTERGLTIADGIVPFVDSSPRLYVKIFAEDVIWIESDSMMVVDLASGSYKTLSDTFRCLRFDGKQVYAANHVVSLYSLSGERLRYFDIRNVDDIWVGGDLLAVLVVDGGQHLQVLRMSSGRLLKTMQVERDPCVCLGPAGDVLYLLEFSDEGLKLSSVSVEGDQVHWTYSNSFGRQLLIHPEIRLLCDRFIFLRPSHTRDENFLLVDSKSGCVVYDSVMPPSLNPPAYIYHLSDEVFITAESTKIHIRKYLS